MTRIGSGEYGVAAWVVRGRKRRPMIKRT